MRFEEDLHMTEDSDIFIDAHANVRSNLDDILSGAFIESINNPLEEDADIFIDMHANEKNKLDNILSGNIAESKELTESDENNTYEMIAARAMHFMRINCDMEYVDIADELGIDVQEVLELIGPDSYDNSDIMLEAEESEEALISEELRDELIGLFWDGIEGYSSDVWFDSSTNEKEEIAWEALKKLGEPVDEALVLDLFWEWAEGLEEDSFIEFDLEESGRNKKLKESYRRTVSRGKTLTENELFVDFD